MANKKREKPKHLGRGLASLFDPLTSDGAEAVLNSGLGIPSAKSEPQMPKTKSGPGTPSAKSEPQRPKTESGLGIPSAKSEPQRPKTESGLGMLSAKTVLQMLKPRSVVGMLGTKTALGIDISDNRINLALLKRDKNRVKLLKAAGGPIPDGAIKNGNIEDPVILADAIKELKTRNKIRAHHTALSLVADPMLMQILDLPKNVPDNVRQFVRNEVKHYAKLPMERVAIDFCGIKSPTKPGSHRALVVAVDGQRITEAAKTLNQADLNIDAIEPASVAYIRACYAKKIAERFDKNLLFAILHEGVLTLCLIRNQTLDFVRTKKLEADISQPDKCCEWLAEEINAVLKFYEFEVPDTYGKWEVTIVTSICNESIKEKMKSLGTKLKAVELEVRTLEDAYLDTPVADTNDAEKPSAIAVGLAMKLLKFPNCGLNVNLLPSHVAEVKSARKQALVIANIAAATLFLALLSISFFNMKAKKINENIMKKQQMQLRQNPRTPLAEKVLLDEQIADVSEKLNSMNSILSTSSFLRWDQILNDIRLVTPKAVQITNLLSNNNSNMSLEGLALSHEAVYLFVDTLNTCKNIESASLVETKKDTTSDNLVMYSINCSLTQ
jgi:Tfp pilus assembly protein PilN